MSHIAQRTAGISTTGTDVSRTSNNAFGEERIAQAQAWSQLNPLVARHLVELGIFQNDKKARERIHAMERRGLLRFAGLVKLIGHDEKLWAPFPVSRPQHEGEITELMLRVRKLPGLRGYRRGLQVDEHLADYELDLEDTIYGEHDRGTVGYGEVLQRIKGYAECGRDVLWSVPSQTRIDGIIGYARRHGFDLPSSMWFGIYRDLLENISGPWTNAEGQETYL